MTAAAHTQVTSRSRSDGNAVDGTPTWINAQGANFTVNCTSGNNYNFRIRFLIQSASGTGSANTFHLYYQRNATGGYLASNATNNFLKPNNSISSSADQAFTNTSVLTGGTGSYVNGHYSTTGNVSSYTISSANNSEMEFGVTIYGANNNNGDTLDFEVTRGSGGTALATYTYIPRITVSKTEQQTQKSYRFRGDAGAVDATPTWLANEQVGATIEVGGGNQKFRLRFQIQENDIASASAIWNLYCSKNAGAYAQVNTSTTSVRSADAGSDADETAIAVERLTGGTGSFMNGIYDETGNTSTFAVTISNHTEIEYGLELVTTDLANNDTLDFRVYNTTNPLFSYAVTPRVTVLKSTVPGAPTGLGVTAMSASELDLAWTAGTTGGSAITGYKIQRATPAGGSMADLVANTATTAVTYNDTSCLSATQYEYQVAAINIVGLGAYTSKVANTTLVGGVGALTGMQFGPPYF